MKPSHLIAIVCCISSASFAAANSNKVIAEPKATLAICATVQLAEKGAPSGVKVLLPVTKSTETAKTAADAPSTTGVCVYYW